MNISWITVTAKLQAGIEIINQIQTFEFSKLLNYINQSKPNDTDPELEDIKENVGANKFELLTQTIAYIFKQSLKIILKPTTLQKQLVEVLNFHSDKADVFIKSWTNQTKQDFENLGDRYKLEQISWELNVQTSSLLEPKEANPNLRLKFGLTNPAASDSKNLVFQLEGKELLQMYNTIENIQNKIDFLQRTE